MVRPIIALLSWGHPENHINVENINSLADFKKTVKTEVPAITTVNWRPYSLSPSSSSPYPWPDKPISRFGFDLVTLIQLVDGIVVFGEMTTEDIEINGGPGTTCLRPTRYDYPHVGSNPYGDTGLGRRRIVKMEVIDFALITEARVNISSKNRIIYPCT